VRRGISQAPPALCPRLRFRGKSRPCDGCGRGAGVVSPIGFLFLSYAASLEPLCGSDPYSRDVQTLASAFIEPHEALKCCLRCSEARRSTGDYSQGATEMDAILLGAGILFFIISFAYVKACDNL
jgi:hypothetical protein